MPSGIRDMPIELLPNIFRWLPPNKRSDIRLSHVCGTWRDALMKTPEFWADFLIVEDLISPEHYERDVGFWHSFVDRTRPLPLRLPLDGGHCDLIKTVPEHLPRLKWLDVQWRAADPMSILRGPKSLLHPAMVPLPALEHLSLHCSFPVVEVEVLPNEAPELADVKPLVEVYPRLRHLEVTPIFFVPSMVVPTLKTLILHRGQTSLAAMLHALKQCPGLETLHLNHLTPLSLHASQQVTLPHLRSLRLQYAHYPAARTVQHLLSQLQCPSLVRLAIAVSSADLVNILPAVEPIPVASVLTRLIVRLSEPYNDGSRRTYTVTIEGFTDGDAEDIPRLHMITQHTAWHNPHGWNFSPICSITRHLRHSALKELVLSLPDGQLDMTRPDWSALFESFPDLVSLEVHVTSCTTLLKELRHTPPRIPKLESLVLQCANSTGIHHKLVVTLEMRAALGHRLQRLEFWHCNPRVPSLSEWHMARLREVGIDVVVRDVPEEIEDPIAKIMKDPKVTHYVLQFD